MPRAVENAILQKTPEPAAWLTGIAKEHFKYIVPLLIKDKVVCAVDVPVIEAACELYSIFKDRWKWKRLIACGACFAIMICLGVLSVFGYGPLSGIQPLGMAFLDFFDFITNSVMMPISALAICLIVGYLVKPRFVIEEIEAEGNRFQMARIYPAMVKVVCPIFMAVVLVTGLLSYFGIYSI